MGPQPRVPPRTIAAGALLLGLLILLPWVRTRVAGSLQVEAALNRGAAALEQGDARAAEAEWQAAATSAPTNANVYRALGTLYLRQGRLLEARQALNRWADLAPDEPHILCDLADAELTAGTTQLLDAAAQDGVRAAELEPECVRAQTVAGNALITKGFQTRSLPYLRRAVQLKPADIPLAVHFGKVLLSAQQPDEAARVGQRLIRKYPGAVEGYLLLAKSYLAFPADSPEAKSVTELLLKATALDPLSPSSAEAQSRLGHQYVVSGDMPAAERCLKVARYLNPQDETALFDLHAAYQAQGRATEAEAALTEFRKRSAWDNEASTLEKQLLLDPKNEELYRRLGRVSAALGQPERLVRARNRAVVTAPGAAVPAGGAANATAQSH